MMMNKTNVYINKFIDELEVQKESTIDLTNTPTHNDVKPCV